MSYTYVIYTDGSVYPTMPGYGGWAAIIRNVVANTKETVQGATTEPTATNQRMEMTAALRSLERIQVPSSVLMITDCRNLYMAFAGNYLVMWERRSWKRKRGTEIHDKDLWIALRTQVRRHQVNWRWIRSHGLSSWNNEVNNLAYLQAKRAWYDATEAAKEASNA
jgi:ribonuclease HI